MNYSRFDSKAERFNVIRLHCAPQPTVLMNFQKNQVRCSLHQRAYRREGESWPPLVLFYLGETSVVSQQVHWVSGDASERHAWVKPFPITSLAPSAWVGAAVLPGHPDLFGSSDPPERTLN